MNIIEKIDYYGNTCKNKKAHINSNGFMTYEELSHKSNALASYIIEKFGRDKTPIMVLGHKQHEMLISFLACVKAGHAYIPVDSSFPDQRIKDIAEGSKTKLVLNVEDKDVELKVHDILRFNDIQKIVAQYNGSVPDAKYNVKPDDVYYIIYTSGSTGKPKGVQITLSCLESFIKWGTCVCGKNLNENTVFMNQAPYSFDLSVMDLYLSLYNGCTSYSIDKAAIANMKTLFGILEKSDISIWVSTPSFAWMCLADSKFNSSLLSKLKLFLFCGETLSNSCAEKLHERFNDARIVNTYGPTEATVAVTSVEIDENIGKINPLPVGKVKPDCEIYILDGNGNKLPEGQKGEIQIVGDSVSVGYYLNPEMTKKSFSTCMLNGDVKRTYKTGDEGYIKDGLLYYNGRIDFQVKLNGYRIELEDIENNLKKISFVKNAAVIPVKREEKILYLAGVVALNEKPNKSNFEIMMMIKNELRKLLPEYMVPRKIAVGESLPMTINGKIDRKKLAEEFK